ncbi:MAG: protein kinase [Deltaproteobacteria bacterium]|nr:protein kinase [Deltaproteobacteria bacterium]
MTTRDPRSRQSGIAPPEAREATQSLSLDPDEVEAADVSHPSLALGTYDAANRAHGDEKTKVESPQARGKTPPPPAAIVRGSGGRPPPVPPKIQGEDPDERVGRVLGSYRIDELLGKGGMGYVFRAEHVKLGREVALKLLRSDYSRRRDAVARFFQEARTVNRVRHRNIVDVTDFVELDDGTTFIIMELLRGQSLGRWARSGVDLPRALAVLVQICDGLHAAHQVGVVHRDLKPDNVIVVPTSDGAELVKLLDFGVAKLLNRDDEDVGFQTAAGSVIGTPAYMSPEQAGGMLIDARSDIYSLGAIMYELFCGQPMFRGRSFGEYVRKHLTELPTLPRATPGGKTIDPRLEALILRSIEKDPNGRFQNIVELRDALLGMLGGVEMMPSFATVTGAVRPIPSLVPPPQAGAVPPGFGTIAPMGTVLPPAPMPPMPQGPTSHSSVAHLSHLSGGVPHVGYSSQIHPSGAHAYSQIMLPPPVPATPWWVWIVGGAVAIGLGVAAAIWYAGRTPDRPQITASPAPQTPLPQPGPIVQPAEPARPRPQVIAIHFNSLPSASIYADGEAAELCRTPCEYNLEAKDGDKRTFIVRATGHKDGTIVVDLASSQRDYKITLEQLAPVTDPKANPGTRPQNGTVPRYLPQVKTEPAVKVDPKKDPKPEVKVDPDPRPDPKKPDTTKKIDPTDTMDPFKKKKP